MTAQQALAWALSQVGVTEDPPGSNRVAYWEVLPEFQGSPWCGAFVWDALQRAGADLSWTTVRRFVYCPSGLADASSHGPVHQGPPDPGDVVWFDFGNTLAPEHVGLVVSAAGWPHSLETVEGNTSATGSQSNGGEVMRRTRSTALVAGFATPTYPAAPAAAPTEEDPMVRTTLVRCDETKKVYELIDTGRGPLLFYVGAPAEVYAELALRAREIQYPTEAAMKADFEVATGIVIA